MSTETKVEVHVLKDRGNFVWVSVHGKADADRVLESLRQMGFRLVRYEPSTALDPDTHVVDILTEPGETGEILKYLATLNWINLIKRSE